MANMRALRTRIKSIENTRQITKSMRMVSASKLRKTQVAYHELSEFAETSREIMRKLTACAGDRLNSPFLQPHAGEKKLCYVLFVGNRGLCGAYNSAVLKYLQELLSGTDGECFAVVCGRWGREQIAASGIPVRRTFDAIGDTPTAADAFTLTEYLKELYLSGEADRIVLVYQQYRSVLQQEPGQLELLPMRAPEGKSGASDIIFEPDADTLLAALTELVLQNTVYSTLLEAKTGEHSARMTAMTAASDNTDELIEELSLKLNHARQAAITTEISEIVGGASALNQS